MKLLDKIRFFSVFHTPGPEVIIDFIFEEGLFYISIKNIGARPAYKVSTKFDKTIVGVEGKKAISELPLFKCIEFLPPDKEIRTFLDTSSSYFSRNEPTKISVQIRFEDSRGKIYSNTINHNLEIYREIGYTFIANHQ
jgi:hypothetical protein